MSETNSNCYFYDWNSHKHWPSYPSSYGARCNKEDKFFSRDEDDVLDPDCSQCIGYSEDDICESCHRGLKSHKDADTCMACAIDESMRKHDG